MATKISDLCIQQGLFTFHKVNEMLLEFIRELGGAEYLPQKFNIDVPAMNELEKGIEKAMEKGDLQATEDLCDEYEGRFKSYLNKWREQIAQRRAA